MSSLARSASLIMISGFVAQGLQFAGTIVLARVYNAEAYGTLTLVVNWASVFAVICSMQLHIALHIAQGDENAAELQTAGLFIVPMIAIPGSALAWALGMNAMVYAVILGGVMALTNFGRASLARYSANLGISGLTIGRAALAVLTQFGFRSAGQNGLVLGLMTAEISAAASFLYLSFRKGYRPVAVNPLPLILKKRNFTAWGVAQELVAIGTVLLPFQVCNHLYGTSIVGNYGVAYRLIWAPAVILSFGFGLVFLTELSRSPERFYEILNEVHFRKLVVLLVVVALSSVLWMPQLFRLVLGNYWDLAARMSPAVSIAAASFLVSAPFRQLYRVRQKQLLQLCIDSVVLMMLGLAFFLPFQDPVKWVYAISGIIILQNVCMIAFTRGFRQ